MLCEIFLSDLRCLQNIFDLAEDKFYEKNRVDGFFDLSFQLSWQSNRYTDKLYQFLKADMLHASFEVFERLKKEHKKIELSFLVL